jgi:radical SAM protein with 4Fe4S-binding SPASM domain
MTTEFNPVEQAKQSKTFCITPWIHQYVGPVGDVKPCCVFEHSSEIGNLKNNTLYEVWNNDATKELRLKFLNGETDDRCYKCNLYEDNINPKEGFNKMFSFNDVYKKNSAITKQILESTLPDGTVPEHKLIYMDARFNNLCNFSCRTCSPHFSTSWVLDDRKLRNKIFRQTINDGFQFPGNSEDQLYDEMIPHLQNMQEIYFAGGEPMMQKQHYDTLKKLIELGNTNCRIRYSTNFSRLHLGEDDVIDYWKHFKSIQLIVSIDGSYEKAEYWRNGTVWSEIIDNRIRLLKEIPRIKFVISYTLSWVNAQNLVDLHKEWLNLNYILLDNINIIPLTGPLYYSLRNIPNWKKEQIENIFKEHMDWLREKYHIGITQKIINKYEESINFMWQEPDIDLHESLIDFSKFTKKLDNIRKQDFFKIYTEHQDINDYMTEHNLHTEFDY